MARNVLRMKYHPALKKVEFHAYQDGHEFDNYEGSSLHNNYESRPFVLQQEGNAFFDTIRSLFNGAGAVDLEVTATKTDYEDLEQMVEFYNRKLVHDKSNFRLNMTLKAMLPEMDKIYDKVREYGEEAIAILQQHCADFHTTLSDNKNVQESINFFSQNAEEEINNIRSKIKHMDDNTVNLCFVGIYSAGKSSLINAILGYRILPEDIDPKTAHSFYIRSPQNGENVHIDFGVNNNRATLTWSEECGTFIFSKFPAQNQTIGAINTELEMWKTNLQHEQAYHILDYLNGSDSVSPVIDIAFPVPLDRKNLHFKILDTPGTDSNNRLHGNVLREALKKQENSILVFVAPGNHATEGKGNRDLLDLLQNDGKAIDIDRSLFVLNYADALDSISRNKLKNSQIKATDERFKDTKEEKTKGTFEIDLTTKKLFFTSAKAAYIARAVQSDIATKEERKKFTSLYSDIVDEEFGCYYQDNHCATSECATEKMLKRCQAALKNAEGDQHQELYVCSGLFALEDEIVRYGEKYASAVRVHAIIDSVNKALAIMSGRAEFLEKGIHGARDNIEYEIEKIRRALNSAIEDQTEMFCISDKEKLSDEAMKTLHIDPNTFSAEVIMPVIEYIDNSNGIRGFFLHKVKFSETQRDEIASMVATTLQSFENEYIKCREDQILDIQAKFCHNIEMIIHQNGEISPEIREFICKVSPPALKKAAVKPVKDMYDALRESKSFLFFTREYLNMDNFKAELSGYLREIQEKTLNEYKTEYAYALNTYLKGIAYSYMANLESCSVTLHAQIESMQSMNELMQKINETAKDLETCNQHLICIIDGSVDGET